jgi:hypothetical protein
MKTATAWGFRNRQLNPVHPIAAFLLARVVAIRCPIRPSLIDLRHTRLLSPFSIGAVRRNRSTGRDLGRTRRVGHRRLSGTRFVGPEGAGKVSSIEREADAGACQRPLRPAAPHAQEVAVLSHAAVERGHGPRADRVQYPHHDRRVGGRAAEYGLKSVARVGCRRRAGPHATKHARLDVRSGELQAHAHLGNASAYRSSVAPIARLRMPQARDDSNLSFLVAKTIESRLELRREANAECPPVVSTRILQSSCGAALPLCGPTGFIEMHCNLAGAVLLGACGPFGRQQRD